MNPEEWNRLYYPAAHLSAKRLQTSMYSYSILSGPGNFRSKAIPGEPFRCQTEQLIGGQGRRARIFFQLRYFLCLYIDPDQAILFGCNPDVLIIRHHI